MKKTIVILAKSIKEGGYCIAGKDLQTREWIRAVSDEDGGAITAEQSKLTFNGTSRPPYNCKILHQAEIEFIKHAPLYFQPENYVISSTPWLHCYNFRGDVATLIDHPESLWNYNKDSANTDRVEPTSIPNGVIESSLYLVQVQDLYLYKNNNNRTKSDFTYNGIRYENITCTDPYFYNIENEQTHITATLCLSLGKLFEGYHYKFVASIFLN